MKFNNYIIASLLSHILLFGAIIMFYPEMSTEASAPMFDVDIVGPVVEDEVLKTTKIPEIATLPTGQAGLPIPEKPLKEGQPPKTLFGESTESGLEESGKKETKDKAFLKDKEGALPEGEKGLPLKPKSFLFDKETIEKYAKKGDIEEKDLTFDVPEFHHRGYMRMLKDKIESIWKYPKEAARNKISGDLYIRFSIKRDGSLGEVELIRTSGYKDLDEAAIKALKDAEPYWPLSDNFKETELSITGHFIYIIGGFYVI